MMSARQLAGVFEIREAVYDRDRGIFRVLLNGAVLVGTDHQTGTYRDAARAVFRISSPRRICMSPAFKKSAWPPSWFIPTSNEMWVLVEDFSKIIASVWPASSRCSVPDFCLALELVCLIEQLLQFPFIDIKDRNKIFLHCSSFMWAIRQVEQFLRPDIPAVANLPLNRGCCRFGSLFRQFQCLPYADKGKGP